MLIPESWLRSYINPDLSTEDLAHTLTMAGLEVEDVHAVAPAFSGIVVAQIKTISSHPNADKLRICQVDDGSGELLQIVCGAPNAAAGLKVPLAKIGAKLPGDFKIKKAKMRGEESFGMLCSAKELGITQDHAGLMELSQDLEVGMDIRQALNLDEAVFEIKLTPNRGDCLSVLGVAREVQALTAAPLAQPDCTAVPVSIQETLPVQVDAADLCGRFAGRIIKNINAKASTPAYIQERLIRAGQRPVNVLVDLSNYVMLELGRPTHVFDLDKLSPQGLTVRWALAGETLHLLNDSQIELDEKCGVICSHNKPESLAGVMGGNDSAVTLDTQHIFIEAAFWYPEAVAGLTRRFKLSSEAAHRFERGVDFLQVTEHLEYLSRLIIEVCGGQAGPIEDQRIKLPAREPVRMRLARCQKILGIPLDAATVSGIFDRLGFTYQQSADDVYTITPPSFRFDLSLEEDFIEEVARIHGYDNIPSQAPVATANVLSTDELHLSPQQLRAFTAAQDYQEVVNYSFVEEAWERDLLANHDPIRLLNPIASQLAVMRSSLIGGLLANIAHNARRKQSRVRVFELGKVFYKDAQVSTSKQSVKGVQQPLRLAAAAWGSAEPEQWGIQQRAVDFFDVKQDLLNICGQLAQQLRFEAHPHPALHPGRCARILRHEQVIGYIGELHPQWVQKLALNQAPIVFEIDAQAISDRSLVVYKELSNQPVVIRDLAIWLPSQVSYQDLLDTLAQTKSLELIQAVNLFDVWKDKQSQSEERSLALRFTLQDAHNTLNDEQVEQCMNHILKCLQDKLSARLR
ncbi:phenylalanine--tRNA ligase subunit beta [Brackiella oedipodis]|uniref:phenylalanine--tRNA ligase subunit beta n=1 Tax=Brackiella oedipodis TaxID=124225 RepID=UPI0004903DD0|nr:phenylalanine--tRNA ligase subunit beta [Brackiella oedipodis]